MISELGVIEVLLLLFSAVNVTVYTYHNNIADNRERANEWGMRAIVMMLILVLWRVMLP